VVVSASSAPPEIIGPSGTVARDSPAAFVAGITALLAADERRR
jgi:alpha-1,6-mannosyltransferase